MASSIREGIKFLKDQSIITDNILIMVCDQAHVSKKIINQLIEAQEEKNSSIIACSYANTIGTPAIFHKEHFEELSNLTGDHGAKSILNKHAGKVEIIPFEQGSIDIDTIENYKNLTE